MASGGYSMPVFNNPAQTGYSSRQSLWELGGDGIVDVAEVMEDQSVDLSKYGADVQLMPVSSVQFFPSTSMRKASLTGKIEFDCPFSFEGKLKVQMKEGDEMWSPMI